MADTDLGRQSRALLSAARDAHEPTAANRARVRWQVERDLNTKVSRRGWGASRRVLGAGVAFSVLAATGSAAAWWWTQALEDDRHVEAKAKALATPTQEAPAKPGRLALRTPPSTTADDDRDFEQEPSEAPAVRPAQEPAKTSKSPVRTSRAPLRDATPKPPLRDVTPKPLLRDATPKPPPPEPAAEPAREGPSLGEELALVARARAANNRGDPGAALTILRECDRRFRGGALLQERSTIRILALCALNSTNTAKAEAKRFQKRWPRSPQAARLQDSCARATDER